MKISVAPLLKQVIGHRVEHHVAEGPPIDPRGENADLLDAGITAFDAEIIGSDFMIDLTPLIREEVILATPLSVLCRPDCKGLCPDCGADLNERPHTHEDLIDDRWSKLRELAKLKSEETHRGGGPGE